MTLALIGSRGFNNYNLLKSILYPNIDNITKIISGGANGADKLGEFFAKENNIDIHIFYPNWTKYGKRAGFIRNQYIIESCTHVIAFWDGESKGTKSSIDLAIKNNKKIKIIYY